MESLLNLSKMPETFLIIKLLDVETSLQALVLQSMDHNL